MKAYNPFILILLLLTLSFGANAQKVEGMKGQVKGSSEVNFSGGDDWLILLDFVVNVFFAGGYGLFTGFEGEPLPNAKDFNEYPYADGHNGIHLPEWDAGRQGRMELIGHFQNNEDNLYGAYFQARFYPDRFLIIDANHLALFETFDEKEGIDHLSMSNISLQVNRVHHPRFNLYWGLGLMLLDPDITYASPSLSGGFTWFFKKPLAFHAESQIGWPNGTYSRSHQARMQVHIDRFMIYAGYQGTKVGSVGVANWAMGTGVWF